MSDEELQQISDESRTLYHSSSQNAGIRLFTLKLKNNNKINMKREFTPLHYQSRVNSTVLITYDYEDEKEKNGDEEEQENNNCKNSSNYKMLLLDNSNETDHESDLKTENIDLSRTQTNPNDCSPINNRPLKNRYNSQQFNFYLNNNFTSSNNKNNNNNDYVASKLIFSNNKEDKKKLKNELKKNASSIFFKKCKQKFNEINKSSFAPANNTPTTKNNIITINDTTTNNIFNKLNNKENSTKITFQHSHLIKCRSKKSKNKLKSEDQEQKQDFEKNKRKKSNASDDNKKNLKKIILSPGSAKIKIQNNHNEHRSKNKLERKKLKEKSDSGNKIHSPDKKGKKRRASNEISRKKSENYHLLVQRVSPKTRTELKTKDSINDESVYNLNRSSTKLKTTEGNENTPVEVPKKIKKKNKPEHIKIITKKFTTDAKILILNNRSKKEHNSPTKLKPKINIASHFSKKFEKKNTEGNLINIIKNKNKNKRKRKRTTSVKFKQESSEVIKNCESLHSSAKNIDKFSREGNESPLPSAFFRRSLELRNKLNLKNIDIDKFLKKENREKMQFNLFKKDKESLVFTNTEFVKNDYYKHILDCLEYILDLESTCNIEKKELAKVKFNFSKEELKKEKIALFDLDETLIHCTGKIDDTKKNYQHKVKIQLPNKQYVFVGINLRPLWNVTLDLIKDKYNIVVFTASHQNYADSVLDFMDPEKKYFKHRLYRNNCALVNLDGGKFYIKDLDILDKYYNLKDIVIIDNSVLSFAYHLDNGIPILPYYDKDEDKSLFVVGLYLYNISNFNDLREANKMYVNMGYLLDMVKKNRLGEIDDESEESPNESLSSEEKEKNSDNKNGKSCKSTGIFKKNKLSLKNDQIQYYEIKNELNDSKQRRKSEKSEKKMANFVCNQSKLLFAYTEMDRHKPNKNNEHFLNLNENGKNNDNNIENGNGGNIENKDKENGKGSSNKIKDKYNINFLKSGDYIYNMKTVSEDKTEMEFKRRSKNVQKTIKVNENLDSDFFFFQNGNINKALSIDFENDFSDLKLEHIKSKFYEIFPKISDEN